MTCQRCVSHSQRGAVEGPRVRNVRVLRCPNRMLRDGSCSRNGIDPCTCFAVELMCELHLLRWRLNLHREIRDIVHMHCCGAHIRTVPTNGVAWACIAVLLSGSWVLWYGSCLNCIRCWDGWDIIAVSLPCSGVLLHVSWAHGIYCCCSLYLRCCTVALSKCVVVTAAAAG